MGKQLFEEKRYHFKYLLSYAVRKNKEDLINYYDSFLGKREITWKDRLGEDMNWALSFDNLKETDTTKHVHRLHPYKGKFIPPQLLLFTFIRKSLVPLLHPGVLRLKDFYFVAVPKNQK